MEQSHVYLITVKNGKQYVGKANDPDGRLKSHWKNKTYLGHSLRKHGLKSHDILSSHDTEAAAYEEEQRQIKVLGTLHPGGLNMTSGGSHNFRASDETRRRQSVSSVERWAEPGVREAYSEKMSVVLGTPEVRKTMSEAQKAANLEDPEKYLKGRAAIAKALRTPESRKTMSVAQKRYFAKPGSSEKHSTLQKKRFEDPAERAKISRAQKRRYAKPGARKKSSEDTRRGFAMKRLNKVVVFCNSSRDNVTSQKQRSTKMTKEPSMKDYCKIYNEAAALLGKPLLNKFSSKKVARLRIQQIAKLVSEYQPTVPRRFDGRKEVVYKPAKVLKSYNYMSSGIIGEDKRTLRSRIVDVLLMGATYEEVVDTVISFDKDRGVPSKSLRTRTSDILKIVANELGYGMRVKDGVVSIYHPSIKSTKSPTKN